MAVGKNKNTRATMPSGTYFIGDPCYILQNADAITDNDEWGKIVDMLFDKDGHHIDGQFEWKGRKIYIAGTAYGDGLYTDQENHRYSVDAGLLGAIPIEFCLPGNLKELKRLGQIVMFVSPFICDMKDGNMTFGHIKIDTRGDEED